MRAPKLALWLDGISVNRGAYQTEVRPYVISKSDTTASKCAISAVAERA